MYPYLLDNQEVIIRIVDELVLYEVYFFINSKNGRLVCHRLIQVDGSDAIFKGDNEDYYQTIPRELIIGKCIVNKNNLITTDYCNSANCAKEWIFDRFSENLYWLKHVWHGNEAITEYEKLGTYVKDIQSHPCIINANLLISNIENCIIANDKNWIFSAFYDTREKVMQFRCIKEDYLLNINLNNLEYYIYNININKKNYILRQYQYLNIYKLRD